MLESVLIDTSALVALFLLRANGPLLRGPRLLLRSPGPLLLAPCSFLSLLLLLGPRAIALGLFSSARSSRCFSRSRAALARSDLPLSSSDCCDCAAGPWAKSLSAAVAGMAMSDKTATAHFGVMRMPPISRDPVTERFTRANRSASWRRPSPESEPTNQPGGSLLVVHQSLLRKNACDPLRNRSLNGVWSVMCGSGHLVRPRQWDAYHGEVGGRAGRAAVSPAADG